MDALAHEDQVKFEKAIKTALAKEAEVVDLGEEVMGLTEDLQKVRVLPLHLDRSRDPRSGVRLLMSC